MERKDNTMPSKAVNLRERLKQRWADRREQPEKEQAGKYISSGRMSVVCKCPKCEIEHRSLIRWAGRGTPRVFCSTCRAMIVGMDDSTIDLVAGYAVKSARKPIYQGYE
jgi:hypothetical protein